jgi:hypothetical protein
MVEVFLEVCVVLWLLSHRLELVVCKKMVQKNL